MSGSQTSVTEGFLQVMPCLSAKSCGRFEESLSEVLLVCYNNQEDLKFLICL